MTDTMIFAVAQFIETKFGVTCNWVIGTSLFVGALPEKRPDGTDMPIRCAVILEHDPGALVPDLPEVIAFLQFSYAQALMPKTWIEY